jgi:hypothetical protein
VPLLVLLYLSFTDYQLGALDTRFLGLDNFRKALGDPILRRSLTNTCVYVAIVLPGAVGLGLLIAVLLHRRKRTRSIYEVIYFLPVTPRSSRWRRCGSSSCIPSSGRLTACCARWASGDPVPERAGLRAADARGDRHLAARRLQHGAVPAGLSAIPRDLYEAAEIDGCRSGSTASSRSPGRCSAHDDVRDRHHVDHRLQGVRHGGGDDARRADGLLRGAALRDLPRGLPVLPHGYAAALTLIFLAFVLASRSCRVRARAPGALLMRAPDTAPRAITPLGAWCAARSAAGRARHPDRGAVFILLPFVWMLITSIKSPSEIFDATFTLWPRTSRARRTTACRCRRCRCCASRSTA